MSIITRTIELLSSTFYQTLARENIDILISRSYPVGEMSYTNWEGSNNDQGTVSGTLSFCG